MQIYNELEMVFNRAANESQRLQRNLAAKNRYNGVAAKKGFRRVKTKSGLYILKRSPLKTTLHKVMNRGMN